MKSGSSSIEYWRNYFRSANCDLFSIIDYAITVAAADCPKEFRSRRDRIAERLFSCRLTKCSGCNRVEVAVPEDEAREDIDGDNDVDVEGGVASKESNVNNNNNNNNSSNNNINKNNENNQLISNYSYGEAEALTVEIEEESQVVGEVFRIKDILLNSRDQSYAVLFESLRKLQLMALTVDTLKATEIGKAVNTLRKHGSRQIRHLARTLIDGWKDLVDEWYNAAEEIKGEEGTPESVNPSVVDDEEEEGLPSPPLDEGAFFATQPIELSQFFDGMDDDGNPRNSGEFIKNRENGRKQSLENRNILKQKQKPQNVANIVTMDNKSQQIKMQEVVKPSKPLNTNSGPGRPPKQSVEHRPKSEFKSQHKTDKIASQRKPPNSQQEKFKGTDEVAVQMKLEATKRKLQESYQQAENAKRQRTIQVMELHDLPKQGLVHKTPHMKPGNYNRHWAHGRR